MADMQLWKISRRQAQQHLCTSMRKTKFFTSLKGRRPSASTATFSMPPSAQLWLFQQAHITRGGIVRTLRSACRPSFHQVESVLSQLTENSPLTYPK